MLDTPNEKKSFNEIVPLECHELLPLCEKAFMSLTVWSKNPAEERIHVTLSINLYTVKT